MAKEFPLARGAAKYLGGTRVEFTCPRGHVFVHDYSKGKISKRMGPAGIQIMVRWWAKGGVRVDCAKCAQAHRKQLPL